MQLELIFPLLLLQPCGKLRKTLISIWRIRILGFHHYGNTPLQPYLSYDPTSDPGIAPRQWVHFQGVHNILDLLSWDQEELKAVPAQQVYSLDDHGQGLYLRTNQIKQMFGLITYMKHVFGAYNSDPRDDPFHPFTPDEWSQQTSTMLRTYLIQHLPNPNGPEPVPSGPIPSSRPTGYSPAAIELMGWKELSEHMRTSSKGASEKRRLTQYVTNIVLDDNFKGTTEQFVLHFNEQFR